MPGAYTIEAETQPIRFGLQRVAAVSLLKCERDPSLVDRVTFFLYMLSRPQSLLHGWSRNSISFSGCLIPVAQCLLSGFACSETHSSHQGSTDYQQMPVLRRSRARNEISWSSCFVFRRFVYELMALSECLLSK